MRHLQPDRSQQDHVDCAESSLGCQCSGKNERAWCVILLSRIASRAAKRH
jgi:hypothetical protein